MDNFVAKFSKNSVLTWFHWHSWVLPLVWNTFFLLAFEFSHYCSLIPLLLFSQCPLQVSLPLPIIYMYSINDGYQVPAPRHILQLQLCPSLTDQMCPWDFLQSCGEWWLFIHLCTLLLKKLQPYLLSHIQNAYVKKSTFGLALISSWVSLKHLHIQSARNCLPLIALMKSRFCSYYFCLVDL